jgi:hypothetical protein
MKSLDGTSFDFSHSAELMERAEAATRKWIDGGGLMSHSRPQELAPHHHHP